MKELTIKDMQQISGGNLDGMVLGQMGGGGLGYVVGMYFGGPAGAQVGLELGSMVGGAIGDAVTGKQPRP